MTDEVLDFVKKRNEVIEEKRRNFERVMFDNVLGAYSVIDDAGTIYPVSLVDISYSGCLIQVPVNKENKKTFAKGTEVPFRIYFTEKSFIPTVLKIKYFKEHSDDGGQTFVRYGCEFNKDTASFSALKSFIEFLYSFAEHSIIDKGDSRVYFL